MHFAAPAHRGALEESQDQVKLDERSSTLEEHQDPVQSSWMNDPVCAGCTVKLDWGGSDSVEVTEYTELQENAWMVWRTTGFLQDCVTKAERF